MRSYHNPLCRHGDFADPFVLRHNGRYYLYCTNPGVLCWSSGDLINWQAEGPVVPEEEFPGLVPFAPEVTYENGTFYMYTSPHGLGHYVLKSESPLGPFRKITPNIGHNIDFSVFLDEDGKRYAFWADDQGILGCEMPSPVTFGEPVLVGAFLHGWTEGPFVVKEDGVYYLTFTGNHYLSKGYRIHEGIASHPLGPYHDNPHNPLAVRTEGDVVGLGHSSTVIGPDLTSRYLLYHNLNPDRTRDLNLDRLVLHPDGSCLLGPTTAPQPVPAAPLFSDVPHDPEKWIIRYGVWSASKDGCESSGTFASILTLPLPQEAAVEMHVQALSADTGRYGVRLSRRLDDLTICLSRAKNELTVELPDRHKYTFPLPIGFRHEALHCLRLTGGQRCTVHLDHLFIGRFDWPMAGAHISYWADGPLHTGFTAFSDSHEPVWPAPSFLPHLSDFLVNIERAGSYTFVLCQTGHVDLRLDGLPVQPCRFESGGGPGLLTLYLPAGIHTLSVTGGKAVQFYPTPPGGNASFAVKQLGPWAKQCAKEIHGDLRCDAAWEIVPCEPDWQAGVLMHASELADGGEGDDPVLGSDFFIGYRVSVDAVSLSLWKHRYDARMLSQVELASPPTRLRIEMRLNRISVWADGRLLVDRTDAQPILTGRTGFHTRGCMLVSGVIHVQNPDTDVKG